jgi:integrase
MARVRQSAVRVFQPNGSSIWRGECRLAEDELARLNNLLPAFLEGRTLRADGRGRIQFSFDCAEEAVARRRCVELTRRIEQVLTDPLAGVRREAGDKTVAEFFTVMAEREKDRADQWANPVQAKRQRLITPETATECERKRSYFLTFLAERGYGVLKVGRVGVEHVAQFLDWMSAKGYQSTTQVGVKNYLSGLWRRGAHMGMVAANPFNHPDVRVAEVSIPDENKVTFIQNQDLHGECARLYRLPDSDDNNGLILLMLTGARPSDLCTIQRGDVVTLDGQSFIKDLQSKTGQRKLLPVTPFVAPVLARQFARHNGLYLFPFEAEAKVADKRRYWTKRWNRQVARVVTVAHASCKTFRYTLETAGHALGLSPIIIDRLMGHKRNEREMREVYFHGTPAMLYEAAIRIQSHLLQTAATAERSGEARKQL